MCDLGVMMRTAQHRGVEHAGHGQVSGIQRLSPHLRGGIVARRRFCLERLRLRIVAGSLCDSFHDAVVASAAAKIAAERPHDLTPGGFGITVKESLSRHDHPGSAESALDGVRIKERLLERVHLVRGAKAFDRLHVSAV